MRDRTFGYVVGASVLMLLASPAFAAGGGGGFTSYIVGNPADVVRPTTGLWVAQGGGTDVDENFVRMGAASGGGDFVVINFNGGNGYNDYILSLCNCDSVETIVFKNKNASTNQTVINKIRNAEALFIAGGDQSNYINMWKDTPIEDAINFVANKPAPIGGTSAGMAIQGEFIYNGCTGSATSAEILANPFHRNATFTYDYFAWNDMGDVLTEQHLVTRDRMGRLYGFLARQIQDGRTPSALGVAADEVTSIVVDKNGLATFYGSGNAYFVLADHFPELCQARKPLTYSGYKMWRRFPGQTFNLRNRPTTPDYTISVTGGVLSGNPY